ncbi:MAG: SAM-dependent methyltransferase [Pseudomonadota bacterium]|nr:SAM-dependent methyltransferase [Pseudomonadota bacterium]
MQKSHARSFETGSFAAFMDFALYHPTLGYYQSPSRQACRGDYLTAPTLSPIFAASIAAFCAPYLQKNPEWSIMEIGPGDGQLCVDLLTFLGPDLPQQYHLVDHTLNKHSFLSHTLQEKLPEKHQGLIQIRASPITDFKGIIIANEVLDAMPVHLVVSNNDLILKEYFVAYQAKKHQYTWFTNTPHPDVMHTFNDRGIPLYPNHQYEISLAIPQWIHNLDTYVSQGLALFIDYGYSRSEYYHPKRPQGTLTCYRQHQQHHNPLINVGNQDISAHVDFTLLAESLSNTHLRPKAFVSQGLFIAQQNLSGAFNHLKSQLPHKHYQQIIDGSKLLLHPVEMGQQVWFMIAAKNATLLKEPMGDGLHLL